MLQYAGNVVVYSAISPCNGDWFGGINPDNAAAFLDAVADVHFGSSGGVSDQTLRQHWRGRMGLSKEEQLHVSHGWRQLSRKDSAGCTRACSLAGKDVNDNLTCKTLF